MFWLHVLASQGHLQAIHFDETYCTVLTYVNSTRCDVVSILNFGILGMSILSLSSYCGFSVPLCVCCSPGRVYLVLILCPSYKDAEIYY
jgi:hypothetical protein